MKILLVAPEVAPFAKTGGLADVAGALPAALHALGHDVRVIMPLYRTVLENGFQPGTPVGETRAFIDGIRQTGRLRQAELGEVPVYFIEHADYFDRPGLYGDDKGDYPDNDLRFGFFCRAVLEALPELDFRPDVIHVNDWQCGLVPFLLRSEYADQPHWRGTGTLLTLHNLGYQGLFPPASMKPLGLDPSHFTIDGFEYYGKLSFLKAGVVYSDLLNTVSATYCREIQQPEFGAGFDGILHERRDHLYGIVNGIDTGIWNPADDESLRCRYRADDLRGKAICKRDLQKELGLAHEPATPIVAMVTRLDPQKGIDLVAASWDAMLKRDLQFILLGSGEPKLMKLFARLGAKYPGRVSINLDFDEGLAHRIYAGSDLFLMPSRYEPCGLGQLIALRYGAIPVVRRTGGLADTVVDPRQDPGGANGFSFDAPAGDALLEALDRALSLYPDRRRWRTLVRRAMACDHSWNRSARRYVDIYRQITEATSA